MRYVKLALAWPMYLIAVVVLFPVSIFLRAGPALSDLADEIEIDMRYFHREFWKGFK